MSITTYEGSVKAGDVQALQQGGGGGSIFFLVGPQNQLAGGYVPPPYDLPHHIAERDLWLRRSVRLHVGWANAIGVASTKLMAMPWEVRSSIPARAKRARELLLYADGGAGWGVFIGKVVRDYLTTSNGAFIEIERATPDIGSPIRAIHHLDSLRCTRTGNPETPVVYKDLQGAEHELQWWQVAALSDLPEPDAAAMDVGYCAAQRSWRTIVKMAQMERYVWESVSGRTPTDIHFVGNVHFPDVQTAMEAANAKADAQQWAAYQGAVMVGSVAKDAPVSLVSVPLKKMPPNFEPEEERAATNLDYAASIGLDPQDLQPISNQQLGAGAQSQVLADKSKVQGIAALIQSLSHLITQWVLDDKTTFAFGQLTLDDQRVEAEMRQLRVETRKLQIESGEISVEQARQMAADVGDIPIEFIAVDQTPATTLGDDDKPVSLGMAKVKVADVPLLTERFADLTQQALLARFDQAADAILKEARRDA